MLPIALHYIRRWLRSLKFRAHGWTVFLFWHFVTFQKIWTKIPTCFWPWLVSCGGKKEAILSQNYFVTYYLITFLEVCCRHIWTVSDRQHSWLPTSSVGQYSSVVYLWNNNCWLAGLIQSFLLILVLILTTLTQTISLTCFHPPYQ